MDKVHLFVFICLIKLLYDIFVAIINAIQFMYYIISVYINSDFCENANILLLYYTCIVFLVYLFTVEIDKHSEITEENILPAEEKNDIGGNDSPGNFPAEYYDADDEAEYNIIQI
jgi:Ca2+/Na+ antiporter